MFFLRGWGPLFFWLGGLLSSLFDVVSAGPRVICGVYASGLAGFL